MKTNTTKVQKAIWTVQRFLERLEREHGYNEGELKDAIGAAKQVEDHLVTF